MSVNDTIASIVKENRVNRGLSQFELAKLTGYSPAFICNIEKGKYKFTSPEAISRLAKALKIRPDDLYQAAGLIGGKKPTEPKSLQDLTIREIPNSYIEVPIIADMHAPGKIMEYLYLPKTGSSHVNLYGVKIKGDCLSPKVNDGDIIIIDKDDQDFIGKKILCYHNGIDKPEIIKFKNAEELEKYEVYGVILWIMKRP